MEIPLDALAGFAIALMLAFGAFLAQIQRQGKATAVSAGSQSSQTVTGSGSTSWVGMQVAIKNADASAATNPALKLPLLGVG